MKNIVPILLLVVVALGAYFVVQSVQQSANQAQEVMQPLSDANHAMQTQVSNLMNPTPTVIADPVTIIHDIHALDNGNLLVQQGWQKVVEVEPTTGKVVWTYDATQRPENRGKKIEIHAFQPLADGRVMIAESGSGRIIEVDRAGVIQHEIALKMNRPHAHRDTRLARKTAAGTYLVAHEGDGVCREYNAAGEVIWEYPVPMFGKSAKGGHGPEAFGNALFGVLRLPNGNTLIATGNGHRVLEVNPAKEIVWQLTPADVPEITLAWLTTLEVLPNGNIVFGNCHAGPGQPLLVEVERPSKKVVLTFDEFKRFGNSAPNSVLVGAESLR